MKYVMINNCRPLIFFDGFQHSEFKSLGVITSAGFVTSDGVPYGKSISLGLKSLDSDEYFLKKLLKGEK